MVYLFFSLFVFAFGMVGGKKWCKPLIRRVNYKSLFTGENDVINDDVFDGKR